MANGPGGTGHRPVAAGDPPAALCAPRILTACVAAQMQQAFWANLPGANNPMWRSSFTNDLKDAQYLVFDNGTCILPEVGNDL